MATLFVPESIEQAADLEQVLRDSGVIESDQACSGSEAWMRLQQRPYDRIIMGWALSDMSAIVLLNRIRRHPSFELMPVLLISARLLPTDFRLLSEMPCVEHVQNGLVRGEVARMLRRLEADAEWYRTNIPLVDGVLEMAETDGRRAVTMLREGIGRAPNPIPLGVVASRALRANGFAKQAEEVLRLLIAREPECLPAMSELGKALYAQRRYGEAMRVLAEAHRLSPHNISRLCLIGEVELSLEKNDAAQKAFRAALDIDKSDPVAQTGAEIASAPGRFRPSGNDDMNLFFAGILNGKAVELVRRKRFVEALNAYHAARAVLLRRDQEARVMFNVGLAYMRWGNKVEAKPWFERSLEASDGRFTRALRYVSAPAQLELDRTRRAPPAAVEDASGPLIDPVEEPDIIIEDDDMLEESIGGLITRD